MEQLHSIISPSGFSRLVQCPGSVKLSKGVFNPTNEAAKEGTAAHWVLEQMLTEDITETFAPLVAPNGIAINDDMLEAARTAFDYVQKLSGYKEIYVEQRLDIEVVHKDCFGTCDVLIPDLVNGILHVIDFKYGFNPVYASENWQLMLYALGAKKFMEPMYSDFRVHLHIIQPRAHHVTDEWRTTMGNLKENFLPIAQLVAAESTSDNPDVTTGGECKYCPARYCCPAFRDATGNALEMSNHSTPHDLTTQAMGVELSLITRAVEILNRRKDALTVQALEISKGQQIPGWSVTATQSNKKWTIDEEEVLALGLMCEKDLSKKSVITPTQAIKKGIDEAVINNYSKRYSNGLKLEPFNGNKFKRIFNKVED